MGEENGKNKGGRPVTVGADASVHLRLPRKQLRQIERRAKSAGVTVSGWIRGLIERELDADR